MSKIKLGINGFGRVGRCVARLAAQSSGLEVVAINDTTADIQNLAYLYNYDSTYGRATEFLEVFDGNFKLGQRLIKCHCERDISKVSWRKSDVDVVIDSSGVKDNVSLAHDLISKAAVRKVIVTHSPRSGVDHIFIKGVNDVEYNSSRHHVVASSICDANAIAHLLRPFEQAFGLEMVGVTTLHPWLSYQNLMDGPVASQSHPGKVWPDYSLGRSSVGAMIPKNTTAAEAILQVMPEFEGRMEALSYRVPTATVTSADLSLVLKNSTRLEDVNKLITEIVDSNPYLKLNRDSLVSVDYEGESASAVIDDQWTKLTQGRFLKMVLWYDNEWGYASRVLDLSSFLVDGHG